MSAGALKGISQLTPLVSAVANPASLLRHYAEFTRALTCLTKFGEEIDISATAKSFRISSVNSSRSAFAVFVFDPKFFSRYDLLEGQEGPMARMFSLLGKVRGIARAIGCEEGGKLVESRGMEG